jgi:NAD(P)-dependent dehydrogenase (short-subunit alcohol dehydrogenase family)
MSDDVTRRLSGVVTVSPDIHVAVVTGALGGIGASTCEVLAAKGYQVIGVDRQEGPTASITRLFVGDVCDEVLWKRVHDYVGETYGHLDALINIAGRNYFSLIEQADLIEWRSMMDINVLGMVTPIKHLVDLLRNAHQPAIVNMSSISGQIGSVGYSAYVTTKGAVDSLTKSLALELGPKVRINAVCPGWIETPFTADGLRLAADPVAYRREVEAMHALGRVGTPLEIAETICWLASPTASFMTGSIVVVDGGYLIKN